MKKAFLIFNFLLACFAVQSQITFKQGYFLIDSSIATVYNNINYVLNIKDSVITLPQRTAKIMEVEKTEGGLKLTLDNGDIARYKTDPNYGHVFYMIWYNGRLVLWTNYMTSFDINLTK